MDNGSQQEDLAGESTVEMISRTKRNEEEFKGEGRKMIAGSLETRKQTAGKEPDTFVPSDLALWDHSSAEEQMLW